MRLPDFSQLLRVLNRQRPERPTLFEFFLNDPLYQKLAGSRWQADPSLLARTQNMVAAFGAAGYDYATVSGSAFAFPAGNRHHDRSVSMNEGAVIHDRASLAAYPWMDPDTCDDSHLVEIAPRLLGGMKLIVHGPGGVLENVMGLVGYEATCLMVVDDPALATAVFGAVGERLVRYYQRAARHATVGALISNDDWGFKTQPMLSPAQMRQFVFPWHERIVAAIHAAGKPAILHSCGCLDPVMEDIIGTMGYDGKHSFEDLIQPIEEAYEQWHGRIALLGGLDLDFLCRSTPAAVRERAALMLARAAGRGGYALGTGNSVPEYVPVANYFAMISAATGESYAKYL